MQRRVEAVRRRFEGMPRGTLLLLPLLSFLMVAVIAAFVLARTLNYVTVTDEGSGARHVLLTATELPEEIVAEAGLVTSTHDEIVYEPSDTGTADLVVRRAFPVAVEADGETITAQFVEGTVADLLEKSEVELGPEDFVEPAPETPLEKMMLVEVNRVDYVEETRREELTPEAVEAWVAALPEDAEFVESYNGTYDVTYRDRLVNGEVESSEIVELVPLVQPRPADSYTITAGVPCSRIEGYDDIEFGPDGLPIGYTDMWEGAVSTAYSSSGGRGASGLGLYCGTVAVNPNRIPYGTRMYITSADGKFIYGFAIATDTGTALMENHIDLDLYFETNAECLQFGKRGMNVYFFGPEPAGEEAAG
ncbi:ubiquitin-like domain-containing protein [Ruminococcaceae bacterium OttesenSCG-928-D13]|nr:ubiquitin-like domain-containing protein [Ruminococcaceae bacterium OttesenSCG-928-D13]